MSEDDFVENVATTINKNAEVGEYAGGAFPHKRNDKRCKNTAIDHNPGKSFILKSDI